MPRWLPRIEPLLDAPRTRLILSFLIVLSVLPERLLATVLPPALLPWLPLALFVVFAPEVVLRALVWRQHWRQGRRGLGEGLLLLIDVVAVSSFLPWHLLAPGLEGLRVLRLARLLLLISYWGGTLRELWQIVSDRERHGQVLLVLATGMLLSFGAAVLLSSLGAGYDFNEDGAVDAGDRRFLTVFWWSLLQVEDPGNLVRNPEAPLVLSISLALTLAGVLLFSFLVGIGTSAVEELVRRSRVRPPGLSGHTAIVCVGAQADRLAEELGALYRKNDKPFKAAVLARDEPQLTLERRRGWILARRQGDPLQPRDLARIDLAQAKRAVLLATDDDSDGLLFAGLLALRSARPQVPLFAVVEHERDFAAARHAGGPGTTVIGASSFLGHVLARAVLDPGAIVLLEELLTAAGCEVYTYVFDAHQRIEDNGAIPLARWRERATSAGVTLLGVFVGERDPGSGNRDPGETAAERLEVCLDPSPQAAIPGAEVRGLIAIAPGFEMVRDLGLELLAQPSRRSGPRSPIPDPATSHPEPLFAIAPRPRTILVCGASPRAPRLVRLIAELDPGATITLAVRTAALRDRLAADIAAALAGHLPGVPGEAALAVEPEDDRLRVEGGTSVRLLVLDWTDPVRLLESAERPLEDAEVVLLAPAADEVAEPDGQVALDALRLAELARHAGRARPGLRVVAAMRDPDRAELLEQRLGGDPHCRVTVLATDQLRDRSIVQGIFVRGLTQVMLELLGPAGARLERLELAGSFASGPALRLALAAAGVTLVGAELGKREEGQGTQPGRLVVDPRELDGLSTKETAAIRAVYGIIASAHTGRRSSQPTADP